MLKLVRSAAAPQRVIQSRRTHCPSREALRACLSPGHSIHCGVSHTAGTVGGTQRDMDRTTAPANYDPIDSHQVDASGDGQAFVGRALTFVGAATAIIVVLLAFWRPLTAAVVALAGAMR